MTGTGRSSLARRLIWLAAAWCLSALIVTGALLTTFFRDAAVHRLEHGDAETLKEIVAVTDVGRDGKVVAPELGDARSLRVFSGEYWQIAEVGPKGGPVPLARSRSLWDSDLPGPPEGLAELAKPPLGRTIYYDARGPLGERIRAAAMAAVLPNRTRPLIFMAGVDRRPVDRDVHDFATLTWSALGVMGVGLVLAVFVQVRVGLRPLFDLGREIAEVRKGKVQRLSDDYPQEISPLAHEMNALLEHNQEVVERQRTHVGNLAHALKTPLAVMLSEAEHRPGALAEVVTRQSALMRGHVDHHLKRAQAAARAQTLGERTPVEPVIDELAVMLERVFQEKGVVIDWRAPEDLTFRGERQDLQEIVGNILENACKWCRRIVRATAEPAEAPARLRLVVEDDGAGLPEDRRAEVLKRGARLDESAPGSGLGLSIVDELARAYGGKVELGTSTLGGLKVSVDLPAAER